MSIASISGTRDYKRVLAEGKRSRRDGIVVAAVASSASGDSRLGVRVQIGGPARAVRRNRVRRRLRHAFAEVGPARGWDVAVTVLPEAADKGFQELTSLLDHAVTEATGAAR